jgi:hypothetical protein
MGWLLALNEVLLTAQGEEQRRRQFHSKAPVRERHRNGNNRGETCGDRTDF